MQMILHPDLYNLGADYYSKLPTSSKQCRGHSIRTRGGWSLLGSHFHQYRLAALWREQHDLYHYERKKWYVTVYKAGTSYTIRPSILVAYIIVHHVQHSIMMTPTHSKHLVPLLSLTEDQATFGIELPKFQPLGFATAAKIELGGTQTAIHTYLKILVWFSSCFIIFSSTVVIVAINNSLSLILH